MEFNFFHNHPYESLFSRIGQLADAAELEVYVVGGFVRDVFLGRDSKDIDFVVVGNGIDFARHVQKGFPGSKCHYFKNFGTAQIVIPEDDALDIEFVGARRESYRRDSRKPIVEDGTLDDDLQRRDFTINALAVCVNQSRFGEVVDQFGGLRDLNSGLLKTPLEPETTYSDDPLRMMRAVRFATQLQFSIADESREAIASQAHRLSIISQERITDELNKIMLSPKPSVGFLLLDELGLLPMVLPELQNLKGVDIRNGIGHKDNFYHTLQVLDNVAENSENLWLRWAALLHDIGKPPSKRFEENHGWTFHGHEVIGARMTKAIFRKLKLPLSEPMRYVQKLVALHLRPIALVHEVTDSAVRRLIVDSGDDIEDLFILCNADITSKNERKVKRILSGFALVQEKVRDVESRDKLRNWKPPVTGKDVMDCFNLKPSKEVGEIKAAVKEAILNGDIPNQREPALAFMVKVGEQMGFEVLKKLT